MPLLPLLLQVSISKRLDAGLFLYGSIKKGGQILRVNAQLINTKTEEIIKSFNIQGPAREDMIFMLIDSLSFQVSDYIMMSELKKETQMNMKLDDSEIRLISTSSPVAYKYHIYATQSILQGRLFIQQ